MNLEKKKKLPDKGEKWKRKKSENVMIKHSSRKSLTKYMYAHLKSGDK